MGKPQLNLDKKDGVKAPDGAFVKVVTTTEPLPLKQDLTPVSTRRGCRAGRVLCSLLCALLFIVLMCMTIMYFYPSRSWRCGVDYYDEPEYYGQDYYYDSWGSEGEKIPYGDDMLIAPRPTGAPLLRYLEEGVDIDLDLSIIRINAPATDRAPGVSVVHDFHLSLSAYQVPASGVCYIRPLNFDSTLSPEEFETLLEDQEYRNQQFPISREFFLVDPKEVVPDLQGRLGELCGDYPHYYIHPISTDQLPQFWETARQTIHGRFAGTHGRFRSSDSSSEEADELRRPGGRHGGRRGGESSSHSGESSSHSGESGEMQGRQFLRNFIDNLRSFDGQQVVNIHVFQTQNLDGISDEALARLMAFKEGPIAMP